jgi:hypothetical protein
MPPICSKNTQKLANQEDNWPYLIYKMAVLNLFARQLSYALYLALLCKPASMAGYPALIFNQTCVSLLN